VPNPLPNWYRTDRTCDFHQGASGHDIENCYSFKEAVQKLIESGDLSFTDNPPNAQHHPLPPHGPAVNMVESYQENGRIHKVQDIKTPLVPIHAKMCKPLFSVTIMPPATNALQIPVGVSWSKEIYKE